MATLPSILGLLLDEAISVCRAHPKAASPFYSQFILATADKLARAHPDSDGDPSLTLLETTLFASAFAAMEFLPEEAFPLYLSEVKKMIGELFPEILTASVPANTTLN